MFKQRLSRRAFFSRYFVLPFFSLLWACAKTEEKNPPVPTTTQTADDTDDEAQITLTSTVSGNHTHSVVIPCADLDSTLTTNLFLTTSYNSSHTHNISLTPSQVATIQRGSTITVTTTANPHTHQFRISSC